MTIVFPATGHPPQSRGQVVPPDQTTLVPEDQAVRGAEEHSRHRQDVVLLRQLRMLVDVHLHQGQAVGVLWDDIGQGCLHRRAGRAPVRSEVQDHLLALLKNFSFSRTLLHLSLLFASHGQSSLGDHGADRLVGS